MTITEKRQGGYRLFIDWIIRGGDLFIINGLFTLVYYFQREYFMSVDVLSYENKIKGLLIINLSYFFSASIVRTHVASNIINIEKIIQQTTSFAIFYMIVLTAAFSLFPIIEISILPWILIFLLLGTLLIIWHSSFRYLIKIYRRKGYNFRTAIIIGGGQNGISMYNKLIHSEYGFKVLGFFDDNLENRDVLPNYLGDTSMAKSYISEGLVDEVYCTLPGNQDVKIMELIGLSEKNMVRFYLIPEFHKYIKRRFTFQILDTMPVLSLRYEPLEHMSNRLIKRAFDVFFSGLVLITVFPIIYIVFGIAIKRSSPGPILFKQKRTGLKGLEFDCYKFRSMRLNDVAHKAQATKEDPRITKVGAFMRKTSIDEIPQFINVFRGEMSVVGPRPHMLGHTEYYSMLIEKFMVRHLVKPGITGWAQVTGSRGETKEVTDMENRVKKDVWYLENWTFFLDVKIVVRTVLNAIRGESNAY